MGNRKTSFFPGWPVVIVCSVLIAVVIVERQLRTAELQTKLELVRQESYALGELQAENRRLREKQIPADELDRLRADHAALPRLRAEVEQLKKVNPGRAR